MDADKKQIIHDRAKELFTEKGFRDTNIAEIAKRAGIGVGTFYLNYPSKEKLFMEIFTEENCALKQRCLDALDFSERPETITAQMLKLNMEGIRENPILRLWYENGVAQKLEQLFREENTLGSLSFLYDTFLVVVERWQAEGKIRRDIDSRMIMMVFAAIVNTDTHKDEIGLEYFPELLRVMTELVMRGLTDTGAR